MKKYGMTLVEVMIVIILVGLLALVAIPNLTNSANIVRRNTCINNLIQINLAKEQWALENNIEVGDTGSTPVAGDLDSYIRDETASLTCPLDGAASPTFATSYTINTFGTDPICNISGLAQDGDHIM